MPTIVKYILVFFISMVPIIELRGAVPIGVTYFGLNEYITLAVCVVGNMIPVPFIYLLLEKSLSGAPSSSTEAESLSGSSRRVRRPDRSLQPSQRRTVLLLHLCFS